MKNGQIITAIIARAIKARGPIWQIDPVPRECGRVTLLVLVNDDNTAIREVRLFKRMHRDRRCNVKEVEPWLKSGLRLLTGRDF
jgi:hypothetical protein